MGSRTEKRDAVDRLDDASRFGEGGSKTVANSRAEQREVLQVLGGFGSPGRTRTYSLRINSPNQVQTDKTRENLTDTKKDDLDDK